MSVIANQGVLMAPQVVRRVFDSEGQTVLSFGSYARRRVISDPVARTVAGMLRHAAEPGGTAAVAAIPAYEVAGKTGTTQKLVDGRYSRQHHVASFSGFFPSSDPRLVITVIVDEPDIPGPGYGGRVSAPAFKNLAEQLIQYLALPPPRAAEGAGMIAQRTPGP
jgi:cell division protein FtsI (penicillin-binding protein 3)/stage V sporulation protein D (sporulation-specific penicillin-binding protein)